MSNLIGVLGGLGPQATTCFMELVIENTLAETDQEHVEMIVSQIPSIPNRNDYILGISNANPLEKLKAEAKRLEDNGCKYIVMPCNTVHFFLDDLKSVVNIPIVNLIEETINSCTEKKAKKMGIMATKATVDKALYSKYAKNNIEIFYPEKNIQEMITYLIYDCVKKGIPVNAKCFYKVFNYYIYNNCDYVILACTELSIIVKNLGIKDEKIIDSLKVLALKTIKLGNKKIKPTLKHD